MSIDDFALLTRRVIDRDGFEEYLPTACYPDRRLVSVLEGIPHGVDVEKAAMSWVEQGAEGKEPYFVAYKLDARHFKVLQYDGLEIRSKVFEV